MATTVNLRKLLHKKTPEYCSMLAAGNTAAGSFVVSDRAGLLPTSDSTVYVGGASAIWNYSATEDSWMQLPNSGIAGTFGAGACGCLRPYFAPGGANSSTASAGTTTTITTTLTLIRDLSPCNIRVISGTGIGYIGVITKNTMGANSVVTVNPANGVAFDNTTVFQIMSGSLWFMNAGAGAVGFSVYDRATNGWTSRSVTGLPTTWGTCGSLLATAGISTNEGAGLETGTSTGSNTTTTLIQTGKTWPTNGWANSQVRITAGTGIGQIRTISSNTATTLTVSAAWTITPDATSAYVIEGNDDYMYLLGNNAVAMYRYSVSGNTWSTLSPVAARAGAMAAGGQSAWIDGVKDSAWSDGTYGAHYTTTLIKQKGRYIYSFRGGASNVLDVYDIAVNTWVSALPYSGQMETFTTGSSATDIDGDIYIMKDATGRMYRYNVDYNYIEPFTFLTVPQGTAIESSKTFCQTYRDGATKIRFLYSLSNTRQELVRYLII